MCHGQAAMILRIPLGDWDDDHGTRDDSNFCCAKAGDLLVGYSVVSSALANTLRLSNMAIEKSTLYS